MSDDPHEEEVPIVEPEVSADEWELQRQGRAGVD